MLTKQIEILSTRIEGANVVYVRKVTILESGAPLIAFDENVVVPPEADLRDEPEAVKALVLTFWGPDRVEEYAARMDRSALERVQAAEANLTAAELRLRESRPDGRGV